MTIALAAVSAWDFRQNGVEIDALQNIATCGTTLAVTYHGGGRHVGDIGMTTYVKGMYYTLITQSMLLIPQVFTKLAIGITLLRIALQKSFRIATQATIVFLVLYSAMTLIVHLPLSD